MKYYSTFLLISFFLLLTACQSEQNYQNAENKPIAKPSELGVSPAEERPTSKPFTSATDTVPVQPRQPIRQKTQVDNFDWQKTLTDLATELWAAYAGPARSMTFSTGLLRSIKYGGGSRTKVACYISQTKEIRFNSTTLDLIKVRFPADWEPRVATIMGHEIWHHLAHMEHTSDTLNFLQSINNGQPPSAAHEHAADRNGNFLAYLAGYDPRNTFPETIEFLYDTLNIPVNSTEHYPALAFRKNTANEAVADTKRMVHLYQSAQYLLLAKQFEVARLCYDAILQEGYMGPEIYFNRGLAYLLELTSDKDLPNNKYIWPLYLDDISRLKNQPINGGGVLGGPYLRSRLTEGALDDFAEALRIDPSYETALIHQLMALSLARKTADAERMYERIKSRLSSDNQERAKMTMALLKITFSPSAQDSTEARKVLEELQQSDFSSIKKAATWNLAIMDEPSSFREMETPAIVRNSWPTDAPRLPSFYDDGIKYRNGLEINSYQEDGITFVKLTTTSYDWILATEPTPYTSNLTNPSSFEEAALYTFSQGRIRFVERDKELIVLQPAQRKAYELWIMQKK